MSPRRSPSDRARSGVDRSLPDRTRRVVLSLVVFLVLLAGCTGTLVEYAASPATIPDSAVEQQGYVHGNTTEIPVNYPVGVAGVSRNITARTWLSGYSRTTADDDVAGLVLYSSPNVVVEGRSVNPVSQLSNRGLVGFVLERVTELRVLGGVDDVSDLREIGEQNVTVLGTPTQLVSYAGVAEVDGERVGIVVNLVVVEHDDDVVVALGVHEESLDETGRQAELVKRIVHEVE